MRMEQGQQTDAKASRTEGDAMADEQFIIFRLGDQDYGLPIAAVDGTMKKRLNASAAAGQAHIKTGLLEGVRTMAGYVLDKEGRRVVVVFFVNHPRSGNAQQALDALLHWVYEAR